MQFHRISSTFLRMVILLDNIEKRIRKYATVGLMLNPAYFDSPNCGLILSGVNNNINPTIPHPIVRMMAFCPLTEIACNLI
jgi:hypothetical protein